MNGAARDKGTPLPADPLAAIQFLRKVRDQLMIADDPQVAGAFATMLANYEAGGGAEPLDRAFRLTPACGQENWATRERRSLRDNALVRAWETHYGNLKPTGASKVIARDMARIDQLRQLPTDPRLALLAEIHRLNAGGALGPRQILSILLRSRADRAMKSHISLRTFSLRNDAKKLTGQ